MTFPEAFAMQPLAPLDFDLTCQIFSSGDPAVRAYHNCTFRQVLSVDGRLLLAEITSEGTVDRPKLAIRLTANKPITAKYKQVAQEAINNIFSLNFDLGAFYKEIENDSAMHKISQALYGFKFPTTATAFEGLVDAIVEQQISIKVARGIEDKIAKKLGGKLQVNGETYYAFATPENIKNACISDIRECGLSQRKAEYIYNAAELIFDGKVGP